MSDAHVGRTQQIALVMMRRFPGFIAFNLYCSTVGREFQRDAELFIFRKYNSFRRRVHLLCILSSWRWIFFIEISSPLHFLFEKSGNKFVDCILKCVVQPYVLPRPFFVNQHLADRAVVAGFQVA